MNDKSIVLDNAYRDIEWVNTATANNETLGSADMAHDHEQRQHKVNRTPEGTLGGSALNALKHLTEQITGWSLSRKLAVAAIPLAGLTIWGNTPYEVDSTVAYIEVGDGGVNTTCHTAGKLAVEHGLDPNKGDNCVYAGQDAGRDLNESHPKKAVQPGEAVRVTIEQTPLGALTGAHIVKASAEKIS